MRAFAALVLATALLCLAAWPAGAEPSLNLTLGKVDLQAFPEASVVVQLGGPTALKAGALDNAEFVIAVDGRQIAGSTIQATDSQPLPSATVLLIDQSGSMKGAAIAAASEAARRFIEAMRPVDQVAVQAFNEDFVVLQDLTGDTSALSGSLTALSPSEETALYDALLDSLASLGTTDGYASRHVIVLSDGGDTASKTSLADALAQARARGIQVFTVGLKGDEFDSSPLRELAEATGGRYLEAPEPSDLAAMYKSLAREIHNKYMVIFSLPESARGTGAGHLTVTITAGGERAEASKGFFYPGAPTTEPVTTATLAPQPQPGSAVPEPSLASAFAGWSGSGYVVFLAVFALLFIAGYTLSGILFPKRNVLREYSDILENRRQLGPRSSQEEGQVHRGERVLGRLLAVRDYGGPLQRRIEDAGWTLRSSEFVLFHLTGVVVVALVLALIRAPAVVSIVTVLLVVAAPLLYLERKARRRRQAFESQVPDTLIIMANSLRAGQSFEQAMQVVSEEGPEPTAREFQRLLAQQRLGIAPEDALRALADHMGSEAFDWVVMATIIQRQVGGNLAEVYENISATLRERGRLKQEIRTVTAEGRISALILIILPFAIGAIVAVLNPEYLSLLYTTTPGKVMLGGAAAGMLAGITWIRRIITIDV